MKNQTNPESLVELFEEILNENEYIAENEIDDFDIYNNRQYDQMKMRAIDLTYEHFENLGYTNEFIDAIFDAYAEL